MRPKRDKLLLKEFIEKTVKELLREFVDEPEGGPFGKVMFGSDRTDGADIERNTPEEIVVQTAVEDHYLINSNTKLEKYFKSLLELSKQGKYEKILKAPDNAFVYRLTNSSLSNASKLLGISEEELKEEYGPTKEAWYVKTNKNYVSRNKIQSWTVYPQELPVELGDGHDTDVVLLLETNTSGNDFLLNPTATSRIADLESYQDEHEVIAQNPVKLTGAAFYVLPGSVDRQRVHRSLVKAVNAKEFAKKPEIK